MIRATLTGLLALGALAAGCDDTPAPPPQLVSPPAEQAQDEPPARPTTQELLTGPRTQIALGSLPLTVRVPRGWKVDGVEGTNVVLLEGPTPAGDASIQLSSRPTTTSERFTAIINGAKAEQQKDPTSVRMAEVRELGKTRILERQRVGKPPAAILTEEPDPDNSPTFNWTVTVFIPQGGDYETHELNFIGLTLKQYEKDEKLLREIVDSLALAQPAAAASGTPAP